MLREMSYVYAVYQERSFRRAAQKLYISQPALSAMVKKAEQEIGTPIFDRSTNPVTLTPAGQYYIEQVEKVLRIQDEMAAYFHIASASSQCHLRLGGSSFFLSYIYPPVIHRFRERFPDLNVLWLELRNTELTAKLLEEAIDFFLEVDDLQNDQLGRLRWGEERIILAVPAEWPVNKQLSDCRLTAEDIHERRHLTDDVPAVDLSVFAREPFILLREGNDSFRRAVTMCRRAGFTPHAAMTVDQVLTSYYLAAEGHGIAFIRDSILFYADLTEKLYFYRLDDALAVRTVYLFYKKGAERSPIAQAFFDFVSIGREQSLPADASAAAAATAHSPPAPSPGPRPAPRRPAPCAPPEDGRG